MSENSDLNRRVDGIGRLRRLASKELREILRDRRTIITLVLMPILVYPMLGIAFQKFMLGGIGGTQDQRPNYRLVFESEADLTTFAALLEDSVRREAQWEAMRRQWEEVKAEKAQSGQARDVSDKKSKQTDRDNRSQQTKPASASTEKSGEDKDQADGPRITTAIVQNELTLEKAVESGEFDLGVRLTPFEDEPRVPLIYQKFEFVVADRSLNSKEAHEFVLERLRILEKAWIRRLVNVDLPRLVAASEIDPRQANVNVPILRGQPGNFEEIRVTPKAGPSSFLAFFPLMLVLMTITGAVYPAIDLTAGERERGTMEILVAAPVSRMALLAGKFVAVLVVAMLTAIFNMLAMFVTVYTIGLDNLIFGDDGITLAVAGQLFLLLFVFAGFFSAVLLGLTSFARSFKEAQAYLIPLMLIALAPGLVSLLPGIELNLWLAVVPLINIVLLGRDLLLGNFDGLLWAISLVSTILYGCLALAFAAKVFGTDAILSGGSGTWSSMFRRKGENEPTPSMALGMFCLAILFPLFIVIGGISSRIGSGELREMLQEKLANPEVSLADLAIDTEKLTSLVITKSFLNGLVLIALFLALPLGIALFNRLRLSSTFYLVRPSMLAIIAAIMLGISCWTIVYEIQISTLTEQRISELTQLFGQYEITLNNTPLWVKLLCLALAPAVCEEFFFRGFLLSAVRQSLKPVAAILLTSLAFGLFHVFVSDSLFFERLIPSTLLGIVLGFICVKTGSIFPGMLMHLIHNSLMLTTSEYQKQLLDWGIGDQNQSHLPMVWLVLALIPIVGGIGLIAFFGRHSLWEKAGKRSLVSDDPS